MIEFKRMIIKLSDIEGEVATIPTTNDHSDGSWTATDIYIGELFLNTADELLQTRVESGIITLLDTSGGGGSGGVWGSITGTLSSQTDLMNVLNDKLESGDLKTVNGNSLVGSGDIVISVGSFLDLSDTPSSFSGQSGKYVKVKSDESGVEFVEEDETLITTLTEGSSRFLILSDRNKNIENDNNIVLTVPENSSVSFPIGTQIFFTKKFESLSFLASGSVVINSVDNLLELDRINSGASLLKIDDDEWNLIGELK